MSKWQTYARNAVCPFFKGAYERTIRCEGIIPGTTSTQTFTSYSASRNHIKTVCSDRERCETCPIFRANEKKY